MLSGHLAFAALLRHYLKPDAAPTVGGSMAPDLVDKALFRWLGVTNSSRTYGHTLLGATVSTLLIRIFWGKSAARSWCLAYLGHLLADSEKHIPWLYPLPGHRFRPFMRPMYAASFWKVITPRPLEILLLLWASVALLQDWFSLKKRPASDEEPI